MDSRPWAWFWTVVVALSSGAGSGIGAYSVGASLGWAIAFGVGAAVLFAAPMTIAIFEPQRKRRTETGESVGESET